MINERLIYVGQKILDGYCIFGEWTIDESLMAFESMVDGLWMNDG
jgi:hypothetical protein